MLTSEERKAKGRENRQRASEARQQKNDETFTLPHKSEVTSGPRVPQTQREMQMHLSGRHTSEFRDPISRRERRNWDKFWKEKGPGVTKPMRKGERF